MPLRGNELREKKRESTVVGFSADGNRPEVSRGEARVSRTMMIGRNVDIPLAVRAVGRICVISSTFLNERCLH